jgi:hypothetical protein
LKARLRGLQTPKASLSRLLLLTALEARLLRLVLLLLELTLELAWNRRHGRSLRTPEPSSLLLSREPRVLLLKTTLRRTGRLGLHRISRVLLLELRLLLLAKAGRLGLKGAWLSTEALSAK